MHTMLDWFLHYWWISFPTESSQNLSRYWYNLFNRNMLTLRENNHIVQGNTSHQCSNKSILINKTITASLCTTTLREKKKINTCCYCLLYWMVIAMILVLLNYHSNVCEQFGHCYNILLYIWTDCKKKLSAFLINTN